MLSMCDVYLIVFSRGPTIDGIATGTHNNTITVTLRYYDERFASVNVIFADGIHCIDAGAYMKFKRILCVMYKRNAIMFIKMFYTFNV